MLSPNGGLIALAAFAPAATELPPSKPAAIARAAQDCAAAVAGGAVDLASLARAGWKQGVLGQDGKEAETSLRFFGRAVGDPLIIVGTDRGLERVCTVTSRLPRGYRLGDIADHALNGFAALGPVKVAREGSDYVLSNGAIMTILSASGTPKEPGVRVSVMSISEGAK
jgi:hypothetical protein